MTMNKKIILRRFIATAVCLLLTGLSMLLFNKFPEVFFPGYRNFSKAFMKGLAWITSFVPFALWDIGEVLLILLLIVSFIRMIIKKQPFFRWFSAVFLIISLMLTEVVGCWMLNHYAPPLSEELGLEKQKSSEIDLYAAAEYYLLTANAYASLVPRGENGALLRQDPKELGQIAGKSYEKLSESYPVFDGSTAPVKYLTVLSDFLLYRGNSGEFMPLTGEATVPKNDFIADLPFSMCHEAAHRLSVAGEDEANFAAFLACISNDDPRFVYSGYFMAYVYCSNRLSAAVRNMLFRKHADDCPLIFSDARDMNTHYDRYDSPLQKVEESVNDGYLKAFSEESGVQSYGEVTDDLIAWYHAVRNESTLEWQPPKIRLTPSPALFDIH